MNRTALLRQISRTASPASAPLRSSSSSSSSSSLLHQLPSSSTSRSLHTSRPAVAPWSSMTRSPSRRWYSDGTAELSADAANADAATAAKEGEAGAELTKLKADLEAKNKEVVDLKDKYLRSVADFRNLQERSKREQAAARDFAISKFARDLVESIDNLDRALGTVPADKLDADKGGDADLRNLHDGLKMTERILLSTLARHGLERFDPAETADRFDPNRHEAAFMTKMEGKEDGTVFSTMQKGFSLNGRIIRAAKVGVVKNS